MQQSHRSGRSGGKGTAALTDGEHRACSRLIKAYLPLVHRIASQVARRVPANVVHGDLISAGLFGLVDSLRRHGVPDGRFEGYARTRIRGAIVDELRAQDWLSRRARAAAARKESDSRTSIISLNELTAIDESAYLRAGDADPADQLALRRELRSLVDAIEILPSRERTIIAMHYFEGRKFKDIGITLGVSDARISQLHTRALARLRMHMRRVA